MRGRCLTHPLVFDVRKFSNKLPEEKPVKADLSPTKNQ